MMDGPGIGADEHQPCHGQNIKPILGRNSLLQPESKSISGKFHQWNYELGGNPYPVRHRIGTGNTGYSGIAGTGVDKVNNELKDIHTDGAANKPDRRVGLKNTAVQTQTDGDSYSELPKVFAEAGFYTCLTIFRPSLSVLSNTQCRNQSAWIHGERNPGHWAGWNSVGGRCRAEQMGHDHNRKQYR